MISTLVLAAALASASPARPIRLAGDWILNLYIGHTVFNDEVTVRPGADGALGGTLSVPGRFSVPILNVDAQPQRFSFEIVADEGRGPFRVRYVGDFHPQEDVFVGFATLPEEQNRLLGGFTGRRAKN